MDDADWSDYERPLTVEKPIDKAGKKRGPKTRFRLDRKTILLTYPRSDFHPANLATWLHTKLKLWKPIYVGVSQEKHKDGTPHVHALIKLRDKSRITEPRFFDFEGRHPNILRVRDIDALTVMRYIYKEKDCLKEEIGIRPKETVDSNQQRLEKYLHIKENGLLNALRDGTVSLFSLPIAKRALQIEMDLECRDEFIKRGPLPG